MRKHIVFILTALALALCPLIGWAQSQAAEVPLTPADKTQVIDALLKELKANYVFPETADRAATAIRSHDQAGEYAGVTQGAEFARLLTAHLHEICKDAHLRVRFSADPLPVRKQSGQPTPDEIRQMKEFERRVNGGFEKVERLTGNIGYIDLRGFMDPQAAAQPMRAAMEFLTNTDALILDLRQNGGGDPDTIRLLCSYLFDTEPVHLNDIYFRQGNRTIQFWTMRHLPGQRYLNRDVYVLTSKRTASGAEECSYDLQNLKRATIIGDVTWGGANPGGVFRLNDHFSAFIPGGRAINPYTKTNWEGTGIQPDIRVPAEQALHTAHVLALKKLLEKVTNPEEKTNLTEALKQVEALGDNEKSDG